MKPTCLLLSFILASLFVNAQDTTRYTYSLRKLPVKETSLPYEKEVRQYPGDTHSFIFKSPDSCTVTFILRSVCDSLDIRVNNEVGAVRKASKKDDLIMYLNKKSVMPGEWVVTIRAHRYCTYKVTIFGRL